MYLFHGLGGDKQLQFFFKAWGVFHGTWQQKGCIPEQQEHLQICFWTYAPLFMPAHWMLARFSVTHIVLPSERWLSMSFQQQYQEQSYSVTGLRPEQEANILQRQVYSSWKPMLSYSTILKALSEHPFGKAWWPCHNAFQFMFTLIWNTFCFPPKETLERS